MGLQENNMLSGSFIAFAISQKRDRGRLAEWKSVCREIYSSPRITALASSMALKPAWALDLTTVDEEGLGLPDVWSIQHPEPLDIPSYASGGDAREAAGGHKAREVRSRHVLAPYREGRLFLFEHPTSASSWSTAMLKHVMQLEGVHTARFDFCQLGM